MNGRKPPAPMRVATLGSAATFAGEAASRMVELYEGFGEVSYAASMEATWNALAQGQVDAVVLGIERSGQLHEGQPIVEHGWFVLAELVLPIACNLYAKPGARLQDIRKVGGHGSILQCTAWLDANLPGVAREIHAMNSVDAAREALCGDGTMAVVGSRSVPLLVEGIQTLATRIDSGALSNWWAIGACARHAPQPTALVVAARFGPGGAFSTLVSNLAALGYLLRSVGAFPHDQGVSTYEYLVSFDGPACPLAQVQHAVGRIEGARLAGAFVRKEDTNPPHLAA